jgi:IMP dehydrogenase/GMP reductase
MAKKNESGVSTGVVVGAAATAAAAAAGAYWFYGAKDASRHRKSAKSFMLKARAETMEAVEAAVQKMGDIDKEQYLKIVDGVVKRYSSAAGATTAEVDQMTKDLKTAWQHMHAASKNALKMAKGVKKTAKKVVKKAAPKKKR